MAFIQPCFIRKNTPELRKKLEELGYKYSTFDDLKLDGIITFPDRNEYSIWAGYHFNGKHTLKSYINCEDNEELFLALAALRDDTPINSYYWFKGKLVKCESLELKNLSRSTAQYLLKCRYVDNTMIVFCTEEKMLRKATVKEIIEHFKER